MEKRIRQTAGEESEEFPRDNKTWAAGLFELHACTTFINWAPPRGCHPPRLYSPPLLTVRWLKSGTAKTVPAVPAAPALNCLSVECHPTCWGEVVDESKEVYQLGSLDSTLKIWRLHPMLAIKQVLSKQWGIPSYFRLWKHCGKDYASIDSMN